MNILFVETDYLLASGTVRLLQQQSGYYVNATDRPDVALKQCESGRVDLVLLDAKLGPIDGQGGWAGSVDLSQQLKNNPKTAHIPIVLLAAYGLPEPGSQWLKTYHADVVFSPPMTECSQLVEIFAHFGGL